MTPDFEKEIATLTVSGFSNVRIGRPNSSTRSGLISTMWQPLSMREGLFIGKVTAGPVRVQFQMKCLDFKGGAGLTGAKLESELSEKLPSPTVLDEREGKTAAMKSSV